MSDTRLKQSTGLAHARHPTYERLIDSQPHLARFLAISWGGVYAILGVIGLLQSDFADFANPAGGGYILGIRINPLAAIIYLIIGVPGLACAFRRRTAEAYLHCLFWAGLILFLSSIFMANSADHNWLAANGQVIGLGLLTMIGALW